MCCTGFHEWWSAGSLRQNLVNCSGCAEISSVLEVPESLRGTVTLRRGPQLVLLKVRGQHRQGRPPIKSFPVCSYWILFGHAGLCRVESPSVCSGSSLRSFTWHIQAPCPSCWRRTTVCRTTTSDSHKDLPTSLCSGTHSCWKYILQTLVHGLCGPDCDWWLGVMLQEVQLRDQGEGVEVALPEGWALPPAGQCWDHCAALPRHPQHKLPEQGEFTCPDVLTLTSQRTKWETVLLFVQVGWKLNRCSHVQLLADVFSEAVQNNQQTLSSVFQGVGVFGWLVVGEGLPTVRVLPVQRCQKHCSSFNLWLTPGDMGNTLTHLFLHFSFDTTTQLMVVPFDSCSVRWSSVLADGAVPGPRPEHHLWRIGLLTFCEGGCSSGLWHAERLWMFDFLLRRFQSSLAFLWSRPLMP